MTKCILLIINCLAGLSCLSQNIDQVYFEHYSPERGLSQGSGYVSVQFDDFMWLGTQDGLNRFDGYDFKVYKSKQINANFTQTLLNDKKGHLWAKNRLKTIKKINFKKDLCKTKRCVYLQSQTEW